MHLRAETVFLKDANGHPYTQVDQWHDRWIVDDDGNETDEAVSVLVFHARRNENDEEITEEEYRELEVGYRQKMADHAEQVQAHREAEAQKHRDLLSSAVGKLKKKGLTEAEAIALAPFIGNTGEGNAE